MNTRQLSSTLKISALQLGAGILALSIAPSAVAQEECGGITCDQGTSCEMMEGFCPPVLCLEDDPNCSSECEAEPFYYCQPLECDSDADCADYMACVTRETRECPDEHPDCTGLDDASCETAWAAFEASCETGELQECGVRWQQNCEAASDCGEGFDCIPFEANCDCPVDESNERGSTTCDCPAVEGGYCLAVEAACETDEDCLDNWSCQEVFSGGLCEVNADGDDSCEEAASAMQCSPPSLPTSGLHPLAASSGLVPVGGAAGPTTGPAPVATLDSAAGLPTEEADPSAQSGITEDPALTEKDEEEEEAGDEGAEPELPVAEAEPLAQSGMEPEESEKEDSSVDSESSSSGGGCSVGGEPGTAGGGLTALLVGLGLALSTRRRRLFAGRSRN